MKKATGKIPYAWTEEIEREICDRLGSGQTITAICQDDWMPSLPTVYKHIVDDAAFAEQYARARETQGDAHFNRVCAIVDKVQNSELDPQQARVMIDALKWTAGKLRPKVYGDKLELGGKVGLTVTLENDAAKL